MSRRLVVAAAALLALVAAVPAKAGAPAATTGPATSVGARSAIVGGVVDPGGESTSWYVEYGTTTAYGTRTGARSAGNGTSAVDVSQQLTGLATGVGVSLPAGGDERGRHEPWRGPGVHHAGRARGEDRRSRVHRADSGEPRGDRRSERALDRLVDRVRDVHALRQPDGHALGRLRVSPPWR